MAHTQGKNILVLLVLLMAVPAQAQQATRPGARSAEAGVGFGRTLVLAGDEAFIGEPSNVLGPGAVYVFAREPGTGAWTERQRLRASEATFADGFGGAIAVEGEVLLELVVGPDGGVSDVRVLRPLGAGLDEQAVAAVRQWRFAPARRLGTAVAVIVEVAVEFRLR